MSLVSPQGPVYQAGTLSGNPLAMSVGLAQLSYLNNHPDVYEYINKAANYLENGIKNYFIYIIIRLSGASLSKFIDAIFYQ